MTDKTKHFYEFGKFRLDAENPSLWRDSKLVSISPKALETLILLVEKNGEIVSRDELLENVWKDTFVEEGNINYTISLLRKTLENKDLIQTIPRRGYRFVADVKKLSQNGNGFISVEALPPAFQKYKFRWVLTSIFIASLLLLASFALGLRGDKTVNASGNSQSNNPEATQAYARGRMILATREVENREEKAIVEFQRAITFDPTFAAAHAGLAEVYSTIAVKLSAPNSRENFTKAKAAAERALALDENLAEGYLIRGWLKRQADWDWKGAEEDLRRAIELNPKIAIAHQRLAHLLSQLGRHDEALAEIKLAYQLDPISDFVLGSHAPILEARRDYAEGLKETGQFLRENKENNAAARAHATFLYHTGDFAAVIKLGEESLERSSSKNPFAWYSLLAAAYEKTGNFEKSDEAMQKLEALAQNDTRSLYSLAMNYAELGRADEAILALNKCFELHEERMVWMGVEPRFANLQNDLRFRALLEKMNLN
jgi:DNA-binding winged helix-turn-helix (wHTH) protein/Flp pilus assembly protein TadD